jgi:four helix bundle protein
LSVWQEAIRFADLVYELTGDFPGEERFGLTNQMRCAAVSISSNIAEGSSGASRTDFARFVEIATGSLFEVASTTTKRRGFFAHARWRPSFHGGYMAFNKTLQLASPAASPVTFKAARCIRSCRSINQKQSLSWEQGCSRASRTRTNNAWSGSFSPNSLRALTASERGAIIDRSWRWIFSRRFPGANDLIVDAHRDHGRRFIVHADEKLSAFLELETVICPCSRQE